MLRYSNGKSKNIGQNKSFSVIGVYGLLFDFELILFRNEKQSNNNRNT